MHTTKVCFGQKQDQASISNSVYAVSLVYPAWKQQKTGTQRFFFFLIKRAGCPGLPKIIFEAEWALFPLQYLF